MLRHFRINRNLFTGHVAGELASDNRIPRADIDRLIADGSIEEVHEIGLTQILSIEAVAAGAGDKPQSPRAATPPKR
jgi:hypothetical protein